jgi:hypothetical protein
VSEQYTDREKQIHSAKVYLAECKRRRGQIFHAVLLKWAANCRLRAYHIEDNIEMVQMDMFA